MCVLRRMFGAQVCSVVRWLFGCGLVGFLVVLIVPLFLSFLAMPGLCCFLRAAPYMYKAHRKSTASPPHLRPMQADHNKTATRLHAPM